MAWTSETSWWQTNRPRGLGRWGMRGSVLPWSERIFKESSEVSWRKASPSKLGTIRSQNAVVDGIKDQTKQSNILTEIELW